LWVAHPPRGCHVEVPDAARLWLRAGPDHRHRWLWQSQTRYAHVDWREGGHQDHGQDQAGQRSAARQARDQRSKEPVPSQHLQALPGD